MKISTGLKATGCAAALVVFGVGAPAAQANDIQPLKTVFATDVAYAGLGGLRGLGAGSISLTGVSGSVTEAHLFWHGPTSSEDPNVNAAVTFAGQAIAGTNIGTSASNCWGYANSQAYRADVTSLVSGNGDFAISDLVKEDAEINGVQLMVFFDDGNDANNRDVVMFNGNDSNVDNDFDALGWNVSLPGINYTDGTASMDLVVADGQGPGEGSLFLNDEVLDPGPSLFAGDTVPNAGGPDTSGLLWDKRSFDITANLTPGINDLTLTHSSNNDCLSLIVAAVNLPAGAAPNQPPPPPVEETTTTTTTEAPPETEPEPEVIVEEVVFVPVVRPVTATPRFTG